MTWGEFKTFVGQYAQDEDVIEYIDTTASGDPLCVIVTGEPPGGRLFAVTGDLSRVTGRDYRNRGMRV